MAFRKGPVSRATCPLAASPLGASGQSDEGVLKWAGSRLMSRGESRPSRGVKTNGDKGVQVDTWRQLFFLGGAFVDACKRGQESLPRDEAEKKTNKQTKKGNLSLGPSL